MTPREMMLAALRGFLRARSAEAGYDTAMAEINEAVAQLKLNGGHATNEHAMPLRAAKRLEQHGERSFFPDRP
jgi:hypothetical protein